MNESFPSAVGEGIASQVLLLWSVLSQEWVAPGRLGYFHDRNLPAQFSVMVNGKRVSWKNRNALPDLVRETAHQLKHRAGLFASLGPRACMVAISQAALSLPPSMPPPMLARRELAAIGKLSSGQ